MIKLSTGSVKLEHIYSINTLPFSNQFCYNAFIAKDTVCHYCYSIYSLYSFRINLIPVCIHNSKLLAKELKEIPIYNNAYIRFNSHGELINEIHYKNLIAIANKNPWCKFSLFSKRKDIVSSYKGNIALIR